MRRPLFAAALFLVVIIAVRLEMGWADRAKPGFISVSELADAGTLMISGQVYQKDEESVYLKSIQLLDENSQPIESMIENIICETTQAQEIPLGSSIVLKGDFSTFSQSSNPGEFDYAAYYRTLEIGGKLRRAILLSQKEGCWRVREWLYGMKCLFKERLYSVFPQKEAAVMSALLLGDKGDLDKELKDLYKRNGILHILSISSLHITIIGMGVYKLLRKSGMPICPAAAAGGIILILYGCMTGFSVSACRAIGMYLIRMLAEIVGRTYDMLTALGVMAAVMAVKNPYYLQNSGFLLSFTSVLGIGVLYPTLLPKLPRGAPRRRSKRANSWEIWPEIKHAAGILRESLLKSAFASLSITLATLPVQLWFYYEIPVYSVFLNLFVIPFMKPMMITGLLTLVPGLGALKGIDCFILGVYEFLCGCFDKLPFHTWNPGCPKLWQIIVYYVLLLGAAALKKNMKRRAMAVERNLIDTEQYSAAAGRLSAVLICLAVLLFCIRPFPENSAAFLDVGQGDCIIIQTSTGENYLFDCGSTSRSNIGSYVLLPYLKYNGIHTIDAVFLSHPDADHINGALELLETGGDNNITVKQLILPAIEESARQEKLGDLLRAAAEASQDHPISISYISAGDAWDCGSASFTCLHPGENFAADDSNAYSECFYVEFKNKQHWSLLLTGDVEGKGEAALLKELRARNISGITILKVPHHGSRNSTTQEFLQQLSPTLGIISCGRNNRYGHPHAELLERLDEAGTYPLQTAQSGAIIITCPNGVLKADVVLTEP